MKRKIFSLRRLRWKLALSYTLVTVLALLVAEMILVSVLIAFLISPVIRASQRGTSETRSRRVLSPGSPRVHRT